MSENRGKSLTEKWVKSVRARKQECVFTVNNPDEALTEWGNIKSRLASDGAIKYCRVAYEHGTKEETPHLQCYAVFSYFMTFKTCRNKLIKIFGKAPHIEVRAGTHEQARDYCGDEEKSGGVYWVESYGSEDGIGQGKRTDLEEKRSVFWQIKALIDDGCTEYDLYENFFPEMVSTRYTYIMRYFDNVRIKRSKQDVKLESH